MGIGTLQADPNIRNDSKTARMAAAHVAAVPGSRLLLRFEDLRRVLANASARQSGVSSAPVEKKDPTQASIFFLDGDEHRRRRMAIAGFFSPKAIATRHLPVMHRCVDEVIGDFQAKGEAHLDGMGLTLSSAVVAEIVGLTNSNLVTMAKRIEGGNGAPMAARGGIYKLLAPLASGFHVLQFFLMDVRPAIAARRKQRKEDVISRLLDEGRSDLEILVECMTFGLAGMGTTREFLVVAAWHLLESADLRESFLAGEDTEKMAILMEILRLEPVASMIYRTAGEALDDVQDGVPAGARLSLCIRAANLDEAVVGPSPTRLDPDRAKRLNVSGAYMTFGAGAHFCPGFQVALTETRVFLDKLLRVPGLRLARPPTIRWVPPMLMSYELRDGVVTCDRVSTQ